MTRKVAIVAFYGILISSVSAQNQDRFSVLVNQLDSLSKVIPGLSGNVDFTLRDAKLSELFRGIAEVNELNISLRNLPEISITYNFNDVSVKDVLIFLCRQYSLSIEFTNNIILIEPFKTIQSRTPEIHFLVHENTLTLDLRSDTLSSVVRAITKKSNKNVLVSEKARKHLVTAYIKKLPFEDALSKLAFVNNLDLNVTETSWIFTNKQKTDLQNPRGSPAYNRSSTKSISRGEYFFKVDQVEEEELITLNSNGGWLQDIVSTIASELGQNFIFLEVPEMEITGYFSEIPFDDFLDFSTSVVDFTYRKTNDIYLIGSQLKEGVKVTDLYRFKNRSVEGVEDDFIPETLSKNLEVSTIKDLNAILVTGGEREIKSLLSFFEKIDVAVPNVLIEVIVMEVNKGTAVNTGIKAFVADSVPSTQGQLFGGVDLTLSSNSINNLLGNLDRNGIINLGKVSPKFYTSIQAMESNDNLNIRSTPKLSTLNGHEASLIIGQSVYFLIETQNVTGGVNPIVTLTPMYEKVEANLEINITPYVSENENVTLTIQAEFSDFIDPSIEGAPPGNATRQFISKTRIRNEEMIVLGGLEEASKSESGSGVPILSRIPLLKWLFSSKSKIKRDSRLLVFIKPTIVY